MPIPKPKEGEARQTFMSRCLGDSTIVDEYNPTQRMSVCATAYEDSKGDEEKRELRRDVFTTQAEAEERAKEIGCSGFHVHNEDGTEVFMPCASHDAYIAAEGRDVSGYDEDGKKKPKRKWGIGQSVLEFFIYAIILAAVDGNSQQEDIVIAIYLIWSLIRAFNFFVLNKNN